MDVETRPLAAPVDLAGLAALFGGSRNTRRCWCTAFCARRGQFAAGWITGANRRRFEAMATSNTAPMGVLASAAGEAVGWCACGPRSRYLPGDKARGRLLQAGDRDEDDVVWLVPCLFVREDFRGRGVTRALVRAAVALARAEGAVAIESWPIAEPDRRAADAFLGREGLFAQAGFRRIRPPRQRRAIMRLELQGLDPPPRAEQAGSRGPEPGPTAS